MQEDFENGRLATETFYLRNWVTKDAEWYVKSRDDLIFKWTTESPHLTVQETIEAIKAVNENPFVFSYAIAEFSSHQLLGNISIVIDENNPNEGEVMYWLAKNGRGKNIANQAVRLLSDLMVQSHQLTRIALKTDAHNIASQKVAIRAGFKQTSHSESKDIFCFTYP